MLFLKDFEDIEHFDWTRFEEADITREELLSFWSTHGLDGIFPIQDSLSGIESLIKAQKELSIITARNEEFHNSDTKKWLGSYFPEIHHSRVYFANHDSEKNIQKSEICREKNITLMIDDGIHNAEDLVKNGITCLLLEKPWNRNIDFSHPLLYRVKDWGEIIESLQKYE